MAARGYSHRFCSPCYKVLTASNQVVVDSLGEVSIYDVLLHASSVEVTGMYLLCIISWRAHPAQGR
eukprot:3577957-Karenia_brevis.AAC.1